MAKLLSGVFFVSILAMACTSQTNKKVPEDTQQDSVETKTNTSSSAAKVNERGDSAVFIRPIHKYRHQKKIKIK